MSVTSRQWGRQGAKWRNDSRNGATYVKLMGSSFNLFFWQEQKNQNNSRLTFTAKDIPATHKMHSYYHPSYNIHVDFLSLANKGTSSSMAERRRNSQLHYTLTETELHWRAAARATGTGNTSVAMSAKINYLHGKYDITCYRRVTGETRKKTRR